MFERISKYKKNIHYGLRFETSDLFHCQTQDELFDPFDMWLLLSNISLILSTCLNLLNIAFKIQKF